MASGFVVAPVGGRVARGRRTVSEFVRREAARGGRRRVQRWMASAEDEEEPLVFPQSAAGGGEQEPGDEVVKDEDSRKKLWAEIEALQKYLNRVVKAERYAEAAELRDEIANLKKRDPYEALKIKLDEAVKEERYLDAAKIRDELKQVAPSPRTQTKGKDRRGPSGVPSDASNKSEVLSCGIRIATESFFMDEASKDQQNVYVFGYKVKITNESAQTVQLIRRHWRIRTTNGAETEVKGAGVVGRQPVLEPRESFSYTSVCPLKLKEVSLTETRVFQLGGCASSFICGPLMECRQI